MKKIFLFFILCILCTYSVSPQKVFEIEETETLSLQAQAEDPDDDILTFTYAPPLNASGEWQTEYGDEGTYDSSVTVSDGEQAATQEIQIVVTKKEERPTIDSFNPEEILLEIEEGKSLVFSVNASDLNDDPLSYRWTVDGQLQATTQSFNYDTGFQDAGQHTIILTVTDGDRESVQAWSVLVEDVNVDALFDSIRDITVVETDVASLDLPNFESFGLSYKISEPLGDDNLWQTGYDDAGEYTATVVVRGKDYIRQKTIQIVVLNNDRPPELSVTETQWINENQQVELMLAALDPDNDDIRFEAENLPEGAFFDGTTFVWTPDFDFVQKKNLFDYVLEKFRLLSQTQTVEFIAQSNDLSDVKRVKIIVNDVNRPFVFEPIDDIVVNEGDEVVIDPEYSDPDNDEVTFQYSGFMIHDTKKTGFDDAGVYVVKVVATDGFYSQTQFVTVEVRETNRPPQISQPQTERTEEGQEARVKLTAMDRDNDELFYTSNQLPSGAYIQKNEVVWKPPFETVSDGEFTQSFNVTVSDGQESAEATVSFIVGHVNRAPRIVKTSNTLVANIGETISFEIDAVDDDGDELTYEWDLGFFDKYEGGSMHLRKFTSGGEKDVTVTVSDGQEEITKTWTVTVI